MYVEPGLTTYLAYIYLTLASLSLYPLKSHEQIYMTKKHNVAL